MANKKDEKDPNVRVYSEAGVKAFPKEPNMWDRVKESFEPTNTRANLDAVRARRQKYGS